MSSARILQKKLDALIKQVEKSTASKNPWAGIDEAQHFLVKHKDELTAHDKPLRRLSKLQRQQVEQVALNLHRLSKSICLNLDELDEVREDGKPPVSHDRCSNFVNQTAQFIINDILHKRDICHRTLRLEFWIAVLNTVFKMGDLQVASIILTALGNGEFSKLKATLV